MDLHQLKDHMDTKFEDLKKTLTEHLQRTARLETSVKWLSVIMTILLTGILNSFIKETKNASASALNPESHHNRLDRQATIQSVP